jgi:hypothetical protein
MNVLISGMLFQSIYNKLFYRRRKEILVNNLASKIYFISKIETNAELKSESKPHTTMKKEASHTAPSNNWQGLPLSRNQFR